MSAHLITQPLLQCDKARDSEQSRGLEGGEGTQQEHSAGRLLVKASVTFSVPGTKTSSSTRSLTVTMSSRKKKWQVLMKCPCEQDDLQQRTLVAINYVLIQGTLEVPQHMMCQCLVKMDLTGTGQELRQLCMGKSQVWTGHPETHGANYASKTQVKGWVDMGNPCSETDAW